MPSSLIQCWVAQQIRSRSRLYLTLENQPEQKAREESGIISTSTIQCSLSETAVSQTIARWITANKSVNPSNTSIEITNASNEKAEQGDLSTVADAANALYSDGIGKTSEAETQGIADEVSDKLTIASTESLSGNDLIDQRLEIPRYANSSPEPELELESSISELNKYYIYQSDIEKGTLLINKPGHYIVMEDLSFNPNSVGTRVFGIDAQRLGLKDGEELDSYRSGGPLASQFTMAGGPYDPSAFGIGFFAMLCISGGASGSIIDLNGFQIEQSEEHALQQRFFSVIELAGAPFITGQGPHNFGPDGNDAATNIVIRNGTIGRSAHHGIHGNGNQNIVIEDVDFRGYEVAAVALNGVNGLVVEDVKASNRTDIPVLASYSNARFIRSYVDYLAQLERQNPLGSGVRSLKVNGQTLRAQDIQVALQESLNAVFDDIISSGDGRIDSIDSNYYLYNNPTGFIDGNSYGFLTGPVGVQVNGFPERPLNGFETASANVIFRDVKIEGQHSFVEETPVLSNNLEGGMSSPVIDPVGAAFMLRNKTNGIFNTLETESQNTLSAEASEEEVLAANYKPNVLANAQLLVAKNKDLFTGSFLDVSRLSIGSDIVEWAETDAPLSELRRTLNLKDGWIYNVDNMVHVQKGTIGFKMDGVTGAILEDVEATNLYATGGLGFDGQYSTGFVKDTLTGYNGADVYGFTFSASTDVVVVDAKVEAVNSEYGEAFGFASPLDNSTNIMIIDSTLKDLTASGLQEIGPNAPGIAYEYFNV